MIQTSNAQRDKRNKQQQIICSNVVLLLLYIKYLKLSLTRFLVNLFPLLFLICHVLYYKYIYINITILLLLLLCYTFIYCIGPRSVMLFK